MEKVVIDTENPFRDVQLDPKTRKILNNNVIKQIIWELNGIEPQTASNFGTIFAPNRAHRILSVVEVHEREATAGTFNIELCLSGVAPGAGTEILATGVSLMTTANTPQFATLTSSRKDLIVKRGDRLVAKDIGITGSPEGIFIQMEVLEI